MRTRLAWTLALAAGLTSAAPGLALEKTAHVFNGENLGDWNATATCSIGYYNIYTGWIWVWSGFAAGDVLGVVYDTDECVESGNGTLDGTYLYYWTGASYGNTGTHAVYAVDSNDCSTGTALTSRVWLPVAGWNLTLWGGLPVPDRFVVTSTLQDDFGHGVRSALPSDGRGECGVCYPTTRTTNSYLYGNEDSPSCPGSALHDGDCYVEWLGTALTVCTVAVEAGSWGSIKTLYR